MGANDPCVPSQYQVKEIKEIWGVRYAPNAAEPRARRRHQLQRHVGNVERWHVQLEARSHIRAVRDLQPAIEHAHLDPLQPRMVRKHPELLPQHSPTVRRRGDEEVSILGHGIAEFVSNPRSQPGDARVVRTKRDVHDRREKQTNNKDRTPRSQGPGGHRAYDAKDQTRQVVPVRCLHPDTRGCRHP